MGISFYASKAPADPKDLRGWVLGDLEVPVTGTSGYQLLTLLGYKVDTSQVPGGQATPLEFLLRISVAKIEGIQVANERWGEWHSPGYFEMRLDELAEVAREAERIGGQVTWA